MAVVAPAGAPTRPDAERAADPTVAWPPAWRSVIGVLRSRPRGTTSRQVAALSGLPEPQSRQALDALEARGFARCAPEKVLWGCGLVEVRLWRLDLSEACVQALAFLPRRPAPPLGPCPPGVPAEFWAMFWSGSRGSDARLPRDAFHVACTLLDCPDRAAQAWALQHLPIETLEECRAMRGFDSGQVAAALDAALAERRSVACG
ncbi:MAG: hypothetical protein OXG55_06305 [bacterium]|nr:hypothetical protein [bacterium]